MAVLNLTPVTAHAGSATIQRQFRSATGTAPECCGYEVVSISGFDASGPSGSEPYDPRMHEIEYYWTFEDEAYTFAAPVNLWTAYLDSGVAFGPKVTKTWRTGGSKGISLFMYEPSSGKTGVATFSESIGDEDAEYPTTQTHHVDTTGVHTNAPAGATLHTTLDAAWAAVNSGGAGVSARILLERGQTHTPTTLGQLGLNANRKSILITDVGTGTIPTIYTTNAQIEFGQGFGITATQEADLKIQNVRIEGGWDPVTATGQNVDGITTYEYPPKQLLLDGVQVHGHSIAVIPKFVGTRISQPYFCINDTVIDDYRASGLYGDAAWSVTGSRITQNANAMATNGTGIDWVSCARFPSAPYVYVHANDTFSRTGWTPQGAPGSGVQYDLQGGWRFNTSAVDGAFINFNCNAHEGGITAFSFNNVDGNESLPFNAICQNNITVGYSDSFNCVDSDFSGITFRKNLFIQPSGTADSGDFYAFIVLREGSTYNAENDAAPIILEDNTFVCLKTTAQQSSYAPVPILENNPTYTVSQSGTRNLQPDRGGGSIAGMSTTSLWTPRYIGYRDHVVTTMQTSFATPSEVATYDHTFMANDA